MDIARTTLFSTQISLYLILLCLNIAAIENSDPKSYSCRSPQASHWPHIYLLTVTSVFVALCFSRIAYWGWIRHLQPSFKIYLPLLLAITSEWVICFVSIILTGVAHSRGHTFWALYQSSCEAAGSMLSFMAFVAAMIALAALFCTNLILYGVVGYETDWLRGFAGETGHQEEKAVSSLHHGIDF